MILPSSAGSVQGIQPILQFFRTRVGKVYESVSYDGGLTWAEPTPTSMANPDSKVATYRTTLGDVLVAFNNNTVKNHRTPLVLAREQVGKRGSVIPSPLPIVATAEVLTQHIASHFVRLKAD